MFGKEAGAWRNRRIGLYTELKRATVGSQTHLCAVLQSKPFHILPGSSAASPVFGAMLISPAACVDSFPEWHEQLPHQQRKGPRVFRRGSRSADTER